MSTVGKHRRAQIFQKFGTQCFYCGTRDLSLVYNIDHVVPLNLGGHNTKCNMVVSCEPCNSKKKNRPPRVCEMFALERAWGKSLVPRSKWGAMEEGRWIPLQDLIDAGKRPFTRKHRLWMYNPNCTKCGQLTSLTKAGGLDECCITNDNKGAVYKIWCLGCIRQHYSKRTDGIIST